MAKSPCVDYGGDAVSLMAARAVGGGRGGGGSTGMTLTSTGLNTLAPVCNRQGDLGIGRKGDPVGRRAPGGAQAGRAGRIGADEETLQRVVQWSRGSLAVVAVVAVVVSEIQIGPERPASGLAWWSMSSTEP
ncbi:uncharacterized protein PFL1_03201 [Pseudozyma flocculosa PF-1]|uniref:Uncharacterized protein n=1 Tax=Pseudozyma flocculosa PF-1 TaxID=1277687 RepID=A0A061HFQ2_9BASI|nr:uncharacterized protein PFL1_03201 [Pseudozyma flocculosa PF-1]EPQ29446.1 hypothetical protein PFL1_03201 [Pseudozyma flocculosa PF-1]